MQQILSLMSKADVALSRSGVQQILSLMSKADVALSRSGVYKKRIAMKKNRKVRYYKQATESCIH